MRYRVGGSLRSDDPTYVVRQADEQLYVWLKAGDFCYVLNSCQMGKSSLLQRTRERLEKEGYTCVYLDISRLCSKNSTFDQIGNHLMNRNISAQFAIASCLTKRMQRSC
jgi:hypothetical protein